MFSVYLSTGDEIFHHPVEGVRGRGRTVYHPRPIEPGRLLTDDPAEAEHQFFLLARRRGAGELVRITSEYPGVVPPSIYQLDPGWPSWREQEPERLRTVWTHPAPTVWQVRALLMVLGLTTKEAAAAFGGHHRTWQRWVSEAEGEKITPAVWWGALVRGGYIRITDC